MPKQSKTPRNIEEIILGALVVTYAGIADELAAALKREDDFVPQEIHGKLAKLVKSSITSNMDYEIETRINQAQMEKLNEFFQKHFNLD